MSTLGLNVGRTAAGNNCSSATRHNPTARCHPMSVHNGSSASGNDNGNVSGGGSAGGCGSDNTTTYQKCNKNVEMAANIIQQSNVVCFDVDSTVIREEGIDVLAEFCGKGDEVARVTKEAMGGTMTFQDALKIRLDIIQPSQQQIADFLRCHPCNFSRNVKRFVQHLKDAGKDVYLISGGFYSLIAPIAKELNIPMQNVYANKLLFAYDGAYADFDGTQPTSRSGGKAAAVAAIRQHYIADTKVTMIGDGITDLEAVPPANHFIGYGGNVLRPEVQKQAQYYITDFEQLMPPSSNTS